MSFPTSPSDGQTYLNARSTLYQYSSARQAWEIVSQAVTGNQGIQGVTGLIGPTGIQGYTGAGSSIRSYTWVIGNPAVGGVPGPRLKEINTATRLTAFTTAATSVGFNIEDRTAVQSSGTNMLAADMTAGVTGISTTSFSSGTVAADHWLWVDISGVTGSPGYLSLTLSATV